MIVGGPTGSGFIDFDEFVEVMRHKWKGMDIGQAVANIKAEQQKEIDGESSMWGVGGAIDRGELSTGPKKQVQLGPIKLSANIFGMYTNATLFVRRRRRLCVC